jgi:NAD+ synthase (glutamine-hydrolysing)
VSALRVALAQLNPTVGDLAGNAALTVEAYRRAVAEGADLVVAPELVLSGYPPEDLLLRPAFVAELAGHVDELVAATAAPALVFGAPRSTPPGRDVDAAPRCVANSAFVAQRGELVATVDKRLLPSHSIFDESRYFTRPVAAPAPVEVRIGDRSVLVGVLICEDLWAPGVADALCVAGAELLVAVNASPFWDAKPAQRLEVAADTARRCGRPLVYVNCWGAQDGVVFDGGSFALDRRGELVAGAASFAADLLVVDVAVDATAHPTPSVPGQAVDAAAPAAGVRSDDVAGTAGVRFAALWSALTLGVADYVDKNGFGEVVIGLSGGLDSAVTATVAVDALGPQRVRGIAMPGPYSSEISAADALELARRLGIRCDVVGIGDPFESMVSALFADGAPLAGLEAGVTTENLQARLRGMVLMGVSNATGSLVLTTGNKSEVSVGYATLYGDMAGGLAVLSDVFKSDVFALARWRNGGEGDTGPIPQRTITRPPSAELAPDQVDSDSLPPYDVLDAILAAYVERDESPAAVVASGFDAAVVDRVVAMVDRNEYKRRQAAPGIKVSAKAFGRDRRLPITNGYRHSGGATRRADLPGRSPATLPGRGPAPLPGRATTPLPGRATTPLPGRAITSLPGRAATTTLRRSS